MWLPHDTGYKQIALQTKEGRSMPRLHLIIDVPDIDQDHRGLTRLDHALRSIGATLHNAVEVKPSVFFDPGNETTLRSALLSQLATQAAPSTSSNPYRESLDDSSHKNAGKFAIRSTSAWRRNCGARVQKGPPSFDPAQLAVTPDDQTILEFVSAGAPVTARMMEICHPEVTKGRFAQRVIKLEKRGVLHKSQFYISRQTHFNWSIAGADPFDGMLNAARLKRENHIAIEVALGRITDDGGAIDDATIATYCIVSTDQVRKKAQRWVDDGRLHSLDIAHGRRLYAADQRSLSTDPRAPHKPLSKLARTLLDALPDGPTFLNSVTKAINEKILYSELLNAIEELKERQLIRFYPMGRNSILVATDPGLAHPDRSKINLRAEPMIDVLPDDPDFIPLSYICATDLVALQAGDNFDEIQFRENRQSKVMDQAWLLRSGRKLHLLGRQGGSPKPTNALMHLRDFLLGTHETGITPIASYDRNARKSQGSPQSPASSGGSGGEAETSDRNKNPRKTETEFGPS
jgi:hypothetical protein